MTGPDSPAPRPAGSWIGPAAGVAATAAILASVMAGPGPSRTLRVTGGALGVVALPLAFLPFLTLHRHGARAEGGNYMDTTLVVDRGLYGIVRHPQYLAYLLFMAAFALLAQRTHVTVLAGAAAVLLVAAARSEERLMLARMGESYRDYMSRVPRFNLPAGLFRRLGGRKRERRRPPSEGPPAP